jgi:hypothetical protein
MPFRQVTMFRIGCWMAIVTAAVHLAGHLLGAAEPANDTEDTLITLATTYQFTFPDGAERTLMDLMDGMSLAFVLLMTVLGVAGLQVAKHGQEHGALMASAARVMAAGSVLLLVISLVYWFLMPSLLIAMMTFAFAFAAVKAPERVPGPPPE